MEFRPPTATRQSFDNRQVHPMEDYAHNVLLPFLCLTLGIMLPS